MPCILHLARLELLSLFCAIASAFFRARTRIESKQTSKLKTSHMIADVCWGPLARMGCAVFHKGHVDLTFFVHQVLLSQSLNDSTVRPRESFL